MKDPQKKTIFSGSQKLRLTLFCLSLICNVKRIYQTPLKKNSYEK